MRCQNSAFKLETLWDKMVTRGPKNTIFHNDKTSVITIQQFYSVGNDNTMYRYNNHYNNHRSGCTRTQVPLYWVSLLTKLYPSPSSHSSCQHGHGLVRRSLSNWLHCNMERMHSFSRERDSGASKVRNWRRMILINVQQIHLSQCH